MKDPLSERLREAQWRRELTPAEREQLRANLSGRPDEAAEWDTEARLTAALRELRDAPVASNFTARVLQAVKLEQDTAHRHAVRQWPLLHWPAKWCVRGALASVLVLAGLLSYDHVQDFKREERAQSLMEVSSAAALPGVEVLQDFDAIQAMRHAPTADLELLKALE
jgi:anti-sigma factor RsiW